MAKFTIEKVHILSPVTTSNSQLASSHNVFTQEGREAATSTIPRALELTSNRIGYCATYQEDI